MPCSPFLRQNLCYKDIGTSNPVCTETLTVLWYLLIMTVQSHYTLVSQVLCPSFCLSGDDNSDSAALRTLQLINNNSAWG